MSVRAPGYYTSWLHVVTDIPTTSTGINLYQWLGDWTQANYGHRWTSGSKKLNAILTIKSGSIISCPERPYTDPDTGTINDAIVGTSVVPAIRITNDFNYWDRITIINEGKIVGSYGYRKYTGTTSFIPFAKNASSFNTIITDDVTKISYFDVKGAGGDGGDYTHAGTGAGGGGGGAGGRCERYDVPVRPGVAVTANGGPRGQNASYTQPSIRPRDTVTLAAASHGENGGVGTGRGGNRYCRQWSSSGFPPSWFCAKYDASIDPGTGGNGGTGGRDLVGSGGKNGDDGKNGAVGSQRYDSSNCGNSGNRIAPGGDGGTGDGSPGGKGGTADVLCGNTSPAVLGTAGSHYYRFHQRQLFGPAIINSHTNIRLINNGEIAGGYLDGYTIYSVYGANLFETHPTWGSITGAPVQP